MKKFLIIGSNSFSGISFINHLLKNNKNISVLGISRSKYPNNLFLPENLLNLKKKFKFKKIDINKNLNQLENIVRNNNFDYVINFAAQGMVAESWLNPIDWYKTNFYSQIKMFEIFAKNKKIKKIINFSTPEVYGNTGKTTVNEQFNFTPSTPYAVSRAALDLHLNIMSKFNSLPIIITRTANIYGPYQQLYRIIPKTIIKILLNKKINLDGGGKSIRSFIYMDDVSMALSSIILGGKIGETYHVSTNEFISIKNLVKKICYLLEYDYNRLVSFRKDRKGKDQSYMLDSKKLRDKLNWRDQTNLNKGIINTIAWAKNNLHVIKKMSLEYHHKK